MAVLVARAIESCTASPVLVSKPNAPVAVCTSCDAVPKANPERPAFLNASNASWLLNAAFNAAPDPCPTALPTTFPIILDVAGLMDSPSATPDTYLDTLAPTRPPTYEVAPALIAALNESPRFLPSSNDFAPTIVPTPIAVAAMPLIAAVVKKPATAVPIAAAPPTYDTTATKIDIKYSRPLTGQPYPAQHRYSWG